MASAGVLHIFAKLKKGLCKILWNILIFELLLTSKLLLIWIYNYKNEIYRI